MSEIINNREHRQKVLKELIRELHDGKSVEEVKDRFAKLIEGVSTTEISEMEGALIAEGMPVEEIQRLCDVHAAVFKGSIEDIHKDEIISDLENIPGHPVNVLKNENREIEKLIEGDLGKALEDFHHKDDEANIFNLLEQINFLWDIDKHYSRKENLLFPYLEKYGITAPPKVMWGVDDEIRAEIKGIRIELKDYRGNKDEVLNRMKELNHRIKEMIYKEESILLPMCLDTFTEDEWITIAEESDEIGYCLVAPEGIWKPEKNPLEGVEEEVLDADDKGYIKFESGLLKPKELELIFNTLPIDVTFIDKNDIVKYFTLGKERIFARTKAIIGRNVENCHPPASVNVVASILEDFKSGAKDSESFWLRVGDMYVYIRYFAVRDKEGNYMGTIEVSQDIKPIQEIEGEKRLMG